MQLIFIKLHVVSVRNKQLKILGSVSSLASAIHKSDVAIPPMKSRNFYAVFFPPLTTEDTIASSWTHLIKALSFCFLIAYYRRPGRAFCERKVNL